jgi:hypothetical protein
MGKQKTIENHIEEQTSETSAPETFAADPPSVLTPLHVVKTRNRVVLTRYEVGMRCQRLLAKLTTDERRAVLSFLAAADDLE